MTQKEIFRQMLADSGRVVGFTGAGVSTESGISDYRSQGGIWEKFRPVYLDEFMTDKKKRLLYWERKQAMWASISRATPGPAHLFFADLYQKGLLTGLITQNIDGLHEKSGIPAENIVNLHGTALDIICMSCRTVFKADHFMENIDLSKGSPRCEKCSGLLKPNTISFGQNLDPAALAQAEKLARQCDLMIAAGSTLEVQPAASFPLLARQAGARLVIITLSETPFDTDADLVVHKALGEFLSDLI